MSAALRGHSGVARLLLEHGAVANQASRTGATALMLAAENGHVEAAMWLLEGGSAVNQKNSFGHTAEMVATQVGHVEVASLLRHVLTPWTLGVATPLQRLPWFVKARAITVLLCLSRCSGLPWELIIMVLSHCRMA